MPVTWTTNPDDTVLLYPLQPRPPRWPRLQLLLARHPGRRARKALRW